MSDAKIPVQAQHACDCTVSELIMEIARRGQDELDGVQSLNYNANRPLKQKEDGNFEAYGPTFHCLTFVSIPEKKS